MTAQDGGQKSSRFPGLAVQLVRKEHRLIAHGAAGFSRRTAELTDTAHHPGMDVSDLFGRLDPEAGLRFPAEPQAVLCSDSQRIGTGDRIRAHRAGGDAVQRVTQHV